MSELKSTLRNSSRLSGSSRRFEEVKIFRVALFTEQGQCLQNEDNVIHYFHFHIDIFSAHIQNQVRCLIVK